MPQKYIPSPRTNAQTPFIKHKSAHTRPSKSITLVSFLLKQPAVQKPVRWKNITQGCVYQFLFSDFRRLFLNITCNSNYPSVSTWLIIVCGAFKDSTSQASANTFLTKELQLALKPRWKELTWLGSNQSRRGQKSHRPRLIGALFPTWGAEKEGGARSRLHPSPVCSGNPVLRQGGPHPPHPF